MPKSHALKEYDLNITQLKMYAVDIRVIDGKEYYTFNPYEPSEIEIDRYTYNSYEFNDNMYLDMYIKGSQCYANAAELPEKNIANTLNMELDYNYKNVEK